MVRFVILLCCLSLPVWSQTKIPFHAEITGQADASGKPWYSLTLYADSPAIDPGRTQVAVTLLTPQGRRLVSPMRMKIQEPPAEVNTWHSRLQPQNTGRYHVSITISGRDKQGAEFGYKLDQLSFYYSPERGLFKKVGEQVPVLVKLATPKPLTPKPAPESTEAVATSEPNSKVQQQKVVPDPKKTVVLKTGVLKTGVLKTGVLKTATLEEPKTSMNWKPWVGFTLGNGLLLALGVWGYRKRTNDKSADDILSEFSDEKIHPPVISDEPIAKEPRQNDPQEPEVETLTDVAEETSPHKNSSAIEREAPPGDGGLDEALANIMDERDNDGEGKK